LGADQNCISHNVSSPSGNKNPRVQSGAVRAFFLVFAAYGAPAGVSMQDPG
jgi:hypothetical protein